jgi:hypothetical protein
MDRTKSSAGIIARGFVIRSPQGGVAVMLPHTGQREVAIVVNADPGYPEPIAVALRETRLTIEDARELHRRLADPEPRSVLAPQVIPDGDRSLLRRPALR